MGILLFLVSALFSFIFYNFYLMTNGRSFFGWWNSEAIFLDSFFWNIAIEASVFLVLGVFLLYSFSRFRVIWAQKASISWWDVKTTGKIFFRDYLYYIGFLLFYTSIYLIFKNYDIINFWFFVLFINIIILALFLLTNKFFIFKDFIKINTILFSLAYIWSYIYIFLTGNNFFTFVDLLNSCFILAFFLLSISWDRYILKSSDSDKWLLIYLFIYGFLFISFYLHYFIESVSFIFSLISFLFFLGIFLWAIKIRFFQSSRRLLKYLGLIFLYVSCIFWLVYTLWAGLNIFIFLIIAYGIAFNLDVHNKYQNYISLFFAFLGGFFLIYFLFFRYFYVWDYRDFVLLFIFLSLAFGIVIYTYLRPLPNIPDYYFFHTFSYLINIFWVISFLVLSDFHILHLWIILLLESIFIFMSYYKLNSLKTLPDA